MTSDKLTLLEPLSALQLICDRPPVIAAFPSPKPPDSLRRSIVRRAGLISSDWSDVQSYLSEPPTVAKKFTGEYSLDHYFTLATPTSELERPRKGYKWADTNIASSRWLWADLDPAKDGEIWPADSDYTLESGSDVETALLKWRDGALSALLEFAWTPSLVIDSGRGIWGLWSLAEPIEDHDLLGDALKAFVALLPDADKSVCDPSRIARLPGLPNSRTGWIAKAYAVDGASALSAADVDELLERAKPPSPTGSPMQGEIFSVKAEELPAGKREIFGGDNARLASECLAALGYVYRYNLRCDRHEVGRADGEIGWTSSREMGGGYEDETPDGYAPLTDGRDVALREEIRSECRRQREVKSGPDKGMMKWMPVQIGASLFRDGLDWLSQRDGAARDPFKDWLMGLPEWDGVARVDTIYKSAFALGVESDDEREYLTAVARQTLVGAVARAFNPGHAVPETPVLIGPEGGGKSMFAQLLLPEEWRKEWFTDDLSVGHGVKEFVERTSGVVICEWAEMAGLRKRESEVTKSLLTRTTDKGVRAAYARYTRDVPRRFVVVATANDEGTGVLPADALENRRYLPVNARVARESYMAWIDANREQVWAEARDMWLEPLDARWVNVVSVPRGVIEYARRERETARETDAGAMQIVDKIDAWSDLNMSHGESKKLAELCYEARILGPGVREYDRWIPPSLMQVADHLSRNQGEQRQITNELSRRGWVKKWDKSWRPPSGG